MFSFSTLTTKSIREWTSLSQELKHTLFTTVLNSCFNLFSSTSTTISLISRACICVSDLSLLFCSSSTTSQDYSETISHAVLTKVTSPSASPMISLELFRCLAEESNTLPKSFQSNSLPFVSKLLHSCSSFAIPYSISFLSTPSFSVSALQCLLSFSESQGSVLWNIWESSITQLLQQSNLLANLLTNQTTTNTATSQLLLKFIGEFLCGQNLSNVSKRPKDIVLPFATLLLKSWKDHTNQGIDILSTLSRVIGTHIPRLPTEISIESIKIICSTSSISLDFAINGSFPLLSDLRLLHEEQNSLWISSILPQVISDILFIGGTIRLLLCSEEEKREESNEVFSLIESAAASIHVLTGELFIDSLISKQASSWGEIRSSLFCLHSSASEGGGLTTSECSKIESSVLKPAISQSTTVMPNSIRNELLALIGSISSSISSCSINSLLFCIEFICDSLSFPNTIASACGAFCTISQDRKVIEAISQSGKGIIICSTVFSHLFSIPSISMRASVFHGICRIIRSIGQSGLELVNSISTKLLEFLISSQDTFQASHCLRLLSDIASTFDYPNSDLSLSQFHSHIWPIALQAAEKFINSPKTIPNNNNNNNNNSNQKEESQEDGNVIGSLCSFFQLEISAAFNTCGAIQIVTSGSLSDLANLFRQHQSSKILLSVSIASSSIPPKTLDCFSHFSHFLSAVTPIVLSNINNKPKLLCSLFQLVEHLTISQPTIVYDLSNRQLISTILSTAYSIIPISTQEDITISAIQLISGFLEHSPESIRSEQIINAVGQSLCSILSVLLNGKTHIPAEKFIECSTDCLISLLGSQFQIQSKEWLLNSSCFTPNQIQLILSATGKHSLMETILTDIANNKR